MLDVTTIYPNPPNPLPKEAKTEKDGTGLAFFWLACETSRDFPRMACDEGGA